MQNSPAVKHGGGSIMSHYFLDVSVTDDVADESQLCRILFTPAFVNTVHVQSHLFDFRNTKKKTVEHLRRYSMYEQMLAPLANTCAFKG